MGCLLFLPIVVFIFIIVAALLGVMLIIWIIKAIIGLFRKDSKKEDIYVNHNYYQNPGQFNPNNNQMNGYMNPYPNNNQINAMNSYPYDVNNQNYQDYKLLETKKDEREFISDSRITLLGSSGSYAGQRLEFFDSITIGRDPSKVNLIFDSNTKGVSSIHCRIFKENNEIYITDLTSSYGTFVNGKRVQPQISTRLLSGDSIYLGFPDNSFILVK